MRYSPEDSSNGNDNERCTVSYAACSLSHSSDSSPLPTKQQLLQKAPAPLSPPTLDKRVSAALDLWGTGTDRKASGAGHFTQEFELPGPLKMDDGSRLKKASCARAVFKINHVRVEEGVH
jgi:hypothetical protein